MHMFMVGMLIVSARASLKTENHQLQFRARVLHFIVSRRKQLPSARARALAEYERDSEARYFRAEASSCERFVV